MMSAMMRSLTLTIGGICPTQMAELWRDRWNPRLKTAHQAQDQPQRRRRLGLNLWRGH